MRRADRLFQIIQVLRRNRAPLTADAIAVELETSKRTIYRDIATLIGQRIPIRGEAGMGYILEKGFDMPRTRTQIHEGKKIALHYRDEQGRDSERTIWPIAIGYHEAVRILAAWCELRRDFRSFRTDRVVEAAYLDERYPERREALRAKWRRSLVWEQPKEV